MYLGQVSSKKLLPAPNIFIFFKKIKKSQLFINRAGKLINSINLIRTILKIAILVGYPLKSKGNSIENERFSAHT